MRFEMHTNTINIIAKFSAAALVALSGSIALAGEQASDLAVVRADDNGEVHIEQQIRSTMINEAGDRLEVKIDDNHAVIFLNDEKLGEFRVDGDWTEQGIGGDPAKSVRVLKGPGGVLTIENNGSTMKIGSPALDFGQAYQWLTPEHLGATNLWVEALEDGFGDTQVIVRSAQPKVMLGVTMTPPTEDLAMEYGLDLANTTMFGMVMPGLPAARAGLQPNDVVIGINGQDGASAELIREKLATLEPGDTIRFDVIGEAGKRSIDVTLDAYDAHALGAPGELNIRRFWQGDDEALNELRQKQNELREQLVEAQRNALRADGKRARERANEEAARLNEQLQKVTTEVAKQMARLNTQRFFDFRDPSELVLGGDDGGVIFFPEPNNQTLGLLKQQLANSQGQLELREARIRELESRLEAMSQKMDRLEAILLELKDRSRDQ